MPLISFISRWDMPKESLSELDIINRNFKKPRTRLKQTEKNIQGLWNNYKWWNVCVMGIPKHKREVKEQKKYLKQ